MSGEDEAVRRWAGQCLNSLWRSATALDIFARSGNSSKLYILPVMIYCCQAWRNGRKDFCEKIREEEMLFFQRKAILMELF